MENLPIQKRERSKMASKWIIETPSPRERELPAPVGFSRERMALATAQANQKVHSTLFYPEINPFFRTGRTRRFSTSETGTSRSRISNRFQWRSSCSTWSATQSTSCRFLWSVAIFSGKFLSRENRLIFVQQLDGANEDEIGDRPAGQKLSKLRFTRGCLVPRTNCRNW